MASYKEYVAEMEAKGETPLELPQWRGQLGKTATQKEKVDDAALADYAVMKIANEKSELAKENHIAAAHLAEQKHRMDKLEEDVAGIANAVSGLVDMFKTQAPPPVAENAPARPAPIAAELPTTEEGNVRFRAIGRGGDHQHRVKAEQKILVNGEVVYREPKFAYFTNFELVTDDEEVIESILKSQDYKDGHIIVLNGSAPTPYRGPVVAEGVRISGGTLDHQQPIGAAIH